MINSIPLVGWIISVVMSASMAVPFWTAWTYCGIGRRFFAFVPEVYQRIDFWDTVLLFVVLSILRTQIPTLVYVTQTATVEKDEK